MTDNNELKIGEKYPAAAELLEHTIKSICKAWKLNPKAPPHDIAEWILTNCFFEE